MFKSESICKKISEKIGQELNYDRDKIEVVNYGLFIFVQTIRSILLVAVVGGLTGVFFESLIISFTASILRKYSGGVHASTAEKCAIFGVMLSVVMALAIKNIYKSFMGVVMLGVIVFALAYYLIYKLAPVDSEAKPIRKVEKIMRLKKSSIFILTLYLIIVIVNLMTYLRYREIKILIFSLCIYAGILWQVFTLTKSGHEFVKKIDALF